MAVVGMFFWLTGVLGDGRRHAANDGGGDVQRTTPGTSGRVGERRDGRWKAAIDDDSGGGSGLGVGIIIFYGLRRCGRMEGKNLSPTALNSIPMYDHKSCNETC